VTEQEHEKALALVEALLRRFRGATLDMLEEVLLPLQLPISAVGQEIKKQGSAWSVDFAAPVHEESPFIARGRSGKVISCASAGGDENWCELIKARIHKSENGLATGEMHAARKGELEERLQSVRVGDILEVDRFGITAKLESALTEAALVQHGLARGYKVTRMPET